MIQLVSFIIRLILALDLIRKMAGGGVTLMVTAAYRDGLAVQQID